MGQVGIIHDLLVWLEVHLVQPLELDNVAAKLGYSKLIADALSTGRT